MSDTKYAAIDAQVIAELDAQAELARLADEAAMTCWREGCANRFDHTPNCQTAWRAVQWLKERTRKSGAA
jgi:hypothetical protein